jgi:hypothetical protein
MNKHTALDRNGKAHKRNSANRVYSHAIIARRSYEHAVARANDVGRLERSNYSFYAAFLDGSSEFLVKPAYRSEEQHAAYCAEKIEIARKALEGCDSMAAYCEMCRLDYVAAVEGQKARGYFDELICLGWCGRRDLAEKSAARYRANPYYAEVMIAEAQVEVSNKKVAA